MKRSWKLLMIASFLFVSLGITPVYADSHLSESHATLLVNAVQGKAIQVKDRSVFQANFLKTLERYVLKTPSPIEFDKPHVYYCSGFVQEIYRVNGIWIPAHSVAQQASFGQRISNVNKLEPGDLMFFSGSHGHTSSSNKVPAHVAIAIGNGRLLHASGADHQVSVISIDDQVRQHFMFATRLISSV